MEENNLFRQEVINYKRNKHFGEVFINTPFYDQMIVIGFALIILSLFIFIFFAEFSEKLTVRGYINSTPGIITVFPERNGIIATTNLVEGQSVHKNDMLYVINTSSDHISSHSASALIKNLNQQKKIIEKEIIRRKNYLKKLKTLVGKKYYSLADYIQKNEELINLKIHKSSIEQDIIKYKNENSYKILSPISGVISSVLGRPGETALLNKPLTKIIPDKFILNAEVFIPINHAYFLNKSEEIIIHFDAFPKKKYGTFRAKITSISQSILTDDEESKPLRIGQPYYKVIARLNSDYIFHQGEKKLVKPGMIFSAIISGSKRKFWQSFLPN